MGVPWKDCGAVGELVGIKTFANEFLAYAQLAQIKDRLDVSAMLTGSFFGLSAVIFYKTKVPTTFGCSAGFE